MGEKQRINSELKGTTLRVYWVVLKKGAEGAGPREVMRDLGLSSPSVAAYHLDKLSNMGLIEKNASGVYVKKENVKAEVFSDFVSVVGMAVPRFFFYSVLFSSMLLFYLILYPPSNTPPSIMTIIFGAVGAAIMWVETYRAWIRRPF
uniref:ArsR family transcriptional regulator n=1 Tax=Candidatus Methanomethylicus mesodigestus TaxID=1867258 RepID=A0A7C3IL74_9CREN